MHQFEFEFVSSHAGHLRTLRHTGETLNKCNKCNYISAQPSNFRTRIKTKSGESFEKCDYCDNTSSWTVVLRIHVEKIHCGERSTDCSRCGVASFQASNLRAHLTNSQ